MAHSLGVFSMGFPEPPYKKEIHSGKERQKKRDFDRMLADKLRSAVLGDVSPEPLPKDFKTRDDFRDAYVQYNPAAMPSKK